MVHRDVLKEPLDSLHIWKLLFLSAVMCALNFKQSSNRIRTVFRTHNAVRNQLVSFAKRRVACIIWNTNHLNVCVIHFIHTVYKAYTVYTQPWWLNHRPRRLKFISEQMWIHTNTHRERLKTPVQSLYQQQREWSYSV